MNPPRIFISHSHTDNAWCDAFVQQLQTNGLDVWYDRQGLYVGDQWLHKIQHELQERDPFLVIITPTSWASPWIQREIALAISLNKQIITILLKPTKTEGFITLYQHLEMIGKPPWEAANIVSHLIAPSAPPRLPVPIPVAPPPASHALLRPANSSPALPASPIRAGHKPTRAPRTLLLGIGAIVSLLLIVAIYFASSSQRTSSPTLPKTPPSAASGTKKWSFATGSYVYSSPTVMNGIAYVGSDDHNLYAIDATAGTKKWAFATGSFVISSTPTVMNGIVYVGSGDSNLYAIDATAGTKKWAFATGDSVESSPTVMNGIVYVGSFDHNLYAIAT